MCFPILDSCKNFGPRRSDGVLLGESIPNDRYCLQYLRYGLKNPQIIWFLEFFLVHMILLMLGSWM